VIQKNNTKNTWLNVFQSMRLEDNVQHCT